MQKLYLAGSDVARALESENFGCNSTSSSQWGVLKSGRMTFRYSLVGHIHFAPKFFFFPRKCNKN